MKESTNLSTKIKQKKISGWGRRNFVHSKLLNFGCTKDIKQLLLTSKRSNFITRGLGRSYGDSAQLKDNFVLSVNFQKGISVVGNEVTVGGGVSIRELLKVIVPLGYFLPVTHGSSQVTIGGALAADVHGKNHHKVGSIGNHVTRILIIDGNGDIKEIKPISKDNKTMNNFFWATIGGMGLTGVILEATISLIRIETAFMKVETFACNDIDSLMNLMKIKDKKYTYSVAWIDSLNKKGRGILTCGEHAYLEDLEKEYKNSLSYRSNSLGSPPRLMPNGIINKFTAKVFNEIWFKKSSLFEKDIKSLSQFFYPLDAIENWNRIYGSEGFYQYQYVVPDDKRYFISETLDRLNNCAIPSFLCVLKRFGDNYNGLLSFPENTGWTLAIDISYSSNKNLLNVLQELDLKLASLGGKIYLAKDLRQTPKSLKKHIHTTLSGNL